MLTAICNDNSYPYLDYDNNKQCSAVYNYYNITVNDYTPADTMATVCYASYVAATNWR